MRQFTLNVNRSLIFLAAIALIVLSRPAYSSDRTDDVDNSPAHPEAGVSGGSATYSIPIDLSEDRSAYRPNVSVDYSSRAGVGLLGMGWSLSAGGMIHRCPFILDGDGVSREVHYAPDDRICIDGTKLFLSGGDYGKDASTYVPEIDDGRAIKLHGDLNSPDSGFLVLNRDAGLDIYGAPVIAHGAKAPLKWLLTRSIGKSGQIIEYKYDRLADGEVSLYEILYGGSYSDVSKSFTPGKHFVRFTYTSRDDNYSSFLAGGEERITRLLSKIALGTRNDTGETEHVEYAFAYRPGLATARSLLVGVRVCKHVGAQIDCRSPMRFEWQDSKLGFMRPDPLQIVPDGKLLDPEWHPGDAVPMFTTLFEAGDYKANGLSSVLAQSADGRVSVFAQGPKGNDFEKVAVPSSMSLIPSDMSTDQGSIRHLGGSQFVGGIDGKLAVLDWNDAGFSAPAVTPIPFARDSVLMDATGSGQTDVVTGDRRGDQFVVTLYRNEGSSDKKLALSDGKVVMALPYRPGLHLDWRRKLEDSGRAILVRDGERLIRILHFTSESNGGFKVSEFRPAEIGVSDEAITRGFILADINGDGLDDIIYTTQSGNWVIQMNEGFHFAAPVDTHIHDVRSNVGRAGTLVFDVDSDGRDELVFPARRVAEYCVTTTAKRLECSDALDATDPRMDLGIYEYKAIGFAMDVAGNYQPYVHDGMNLIGQANRSHPAGLFGDGYSYLLSPFDRGVANGWFRAGNGSLVECPPDFSCGAHVARPAHIKRDDRSDAPLDVMVGGESDFGERVHWTYYPLSNHFRRVYIVPPLGSPDRFIDVRREYFTSSMYVVGEMTKTDTKSSSEKRYEYGAAEYNTAGRGFDGFKWIEVHDIARKKKYGDWYLQDGPYRGMWVRDWEEDESDDENDYLHGSPGKEYLSFERRELECAGPKDNPVTLRYRCEPSADPNFRVFNKR